MEQQLEALGEVLGSSLAGDLEKVRGAEMGTGTGSWVGIGDTVSTLPPPRR